MKLRKSISTILLTAHLVCIALWFGGVVSWLPLIAAVDERSYTSLYQTHLSMREIAWNVIGWGGIGSFATGLLLSFATKWRLFRYRWVTIKFFTILGLIAFRMFYIEDMMLSNLAILEESKEASLSDTTLLKNLGKIKFSIFAEVTIFISIIALSLTKPWSEKAKPNEAADTTATSRRVSP